MARLMARREICSPKTAVRARLGRGSDETARSTEPLYPSRDRPPPPRVNLLDSEPFDSELLDSEPFDDALHLPLVLAAFERLALVVELFAARESDRDLHQSVF